MIVPVRIRPGRTSFHRHASNGDERPDNRLALIDHAEFAEQRAIGRNLVIQFVWIYEHAIDLDGLRRFHHNLGYGLLGRCIERSPLPFARDRWVFDRGPSHVDIAECARPRAELSDWADEHSQLPIDPECGPGWLLGALPLTDGSTAVSLVVSHYLIDGLGLQVAILDAVLGKTRDLGYPAPRSRTRLRAVVEDACQIGRDAPEMARALVTVAEVARRRRHDIAGSPISRPSARRGGDGDDPIVVPSVTIYIDLTVWVARAEALGGTSNALVAGLAAKFGEHTGRRRADDGAVTLQLPMSDRAEADTRANALLFACVSVDPTRVTTDLHDVRAAIKQALRTMRETPDKSLQLHWLTPLAPKRALKRLRDARVADRAVFCSNVGDLSSMVRRADGTDAEYTAGRAISQRVTRQWLERTGGQLDLCSGRVGGKVFITLVAYQPGARNTNSALRELASHTMAEFKLTYAIG